MTTTVEVLATAFKEAGTPFIVGHPGGESVELMEARARVLRQIEICANNPPSNFATAGGGEASTPTPVAALEATLKEIDDAIANIEGDKSN